MGAADALDLRVCSRCLRRAAPRNGARRFLEFPGPFSRGKVTPMKISNKNIVLRLTFILFDFYNYIYYK
jgi:hypothetical protein